MKVSAKKKKMMIINPVERIRLIAFIIFSSQHNFLNNGIIILYHLVRSIKEIGEIRGLGKTRESP